MTDEELIKMALQLKKDEDDELGKLLKASGFLFVPILLKYILGAEDKLDDALQTDFEEVWKAVEKLTKRFKNKKPPKIVINAYLRNRSFKSTMSKDVVPEFRKAFFGIYDEFNDKWNGPDGFDYRTKSYRDIEKWLKKLPNLMNVTTQNAVTKLVQASYEDGKGIKWLERELSKLPEFTRHRARTTAITEGLRMYSASEYEAFIQNPAVVGKTWRHTHGIKEPRKSHEAADGQTVAVDDFFIINGHSCLYPRDPRLPAKESIQCHCFMEPELLPENVSSTAENGIIDLPIDELTPCLRDRKTGELVETSFSDIGIDSKLAKKLKKGGWNFDWSQYDRVVQLNIDGSSDIQGLVSYRNEAGFTFVDLVESSPKNIGKNGKYSGVGGHLFAIAAEESFRVGNDGFVSFTPKTALIDHYKEELGAIMLPNGNMVIDTESAIKLVEKYMKEE